MIEAARREPAFLTESLLVRLGTAVSLAAGSSLACTVPAALRVSRAVTSVHSLPRVWIALAAAAIGPMFVAIVALRVARGSLRALAAAGANLRAYELGLWLASMLVAFPVFGMALRGSSRRTTALGMAYVLGAITVGAAVAFLCARVMTMMREASVPARYLFAIVLELLAVGGLGWAGLRFMTPTLGAAFGGPLTGTLVDVVTFTAIALLVTRRPTFSTGRALAIVGLPVAAVILALGLSQLDEPMRRALAERAPAFASVARLLVP